MTIINEVIKECITKIQEHHIAQLEAKGATAEQVNEFFTNMSICKKLQFAKDAQALYNNVVSGIIRKEATA